MGNVFAENIISLKLLTDRLCEGKAKSNGLFLVNFQVLFMLKDRERVSPKELVTALGLAKSNLAITAKAMIKEGLIERNKDLLNRKEIFYTITPKGREVIDAKMKQIENLCSPEAKSEETLISKVVKILKEIKL